MTISHRQRMPLPPRIRIRIRLARVLIVGIIVLSCGGVLGSSTFPLLMVLAMAWMLRANEVENGRG